MEVPFERIGMDLIRPFHRRVRGYRFVLVMVDYAKQPSEAVMLGTISAKSVAQALFRASLELAAQKRFLTDQGRSFMSHTLKQLYKLLGMKSKPGEERDELGPEMPNSNIPASLHCNKHLTQGQRVDVGVSNSVLQMCSHLCTSYFAHRAPFCIGMHRATWRGGVFTALQVT